MQPFEDFRVHESRKGPVTANLVRREPLRHHDRINYLAEERFDGLELA